MRMLVDREDCLLCPRCGFEYTHVDLVTVAARQTEDEQEIFFQMDSRGGVSEYVEAPVGRRVGDGRRHRFVLHGTCENGCRFALVFTQHKGITLVEAV
jgi:hypothetical protein